MSEDEKLFDIPPILISTTPQGPGIEAQREYWSLSREMSPNAVAESLIRSRQIDMLKEEERIIKRVVREMGK